MRTVAGSITTSMLGSPQHRGNNQGGTIDGFNTVIGGANTNGYNNLNIRSFQSGNQAHNEPSVLINNMNNTNNKN